MLKPELQGDTVNTQYPCYGKKQLAKVNYNIALQEDRVPDKEKFYVLGEYVSEAPRLQGGELHYYKRRYIQFSPGSSRIF